MSKVNVGAIKKAYESINFVERFEKILTHTQFSNRLTKIDEKQVLSTLNELGYTFKIQSPGPEFYVEELKDDIKFIFSLNVNGGIVLSYIYVFLNNERIEFPYPSLVFTYKFLLNDLDKLMNPATIFVDYEELKVIVKDMLEIYQDFKKAFSIEIDQQSTNG